MKKLKLFSVLALASLTLAGCNLNDSLNQATKAANPSQMVSQAITSGFAKTDSKEARFLSPENYKLLGDIVSSAANNEMVMGLLSKVGLDGYVKNAAALKVAADALSSLTSSPEKKAEKTNLASTALSYFNPRKADDTQNNTFSLLNTALGFLK